MAREFGVIHVIHLIVESREIAAQGQVTVVFVIDGQAVLAADPQAPLGVAHQSAGQAGKALGRNPLCRVCGGVEQRQAVEGGQPQVAGAFGGQDVVDALGDAAQVVDPVTVKVHCCQAAGVGADVGPVQGRLEVDCLHVVRTETVARGDFTDFAVGGVVDIQTVCVCANPDSSVGVLGQGAGDVAAQRQAVVAGLMQCAELVLAGVIVI